MNIHQIYNVAVLCREFATRDTRCTSSLRPLCLRPSLHGGAAQFAIAVLLLKSGYVAYLEGQGDLVSRLNLTITSVLCVLTCVALAR